MAANNLAADSVTLGLSAGQPLAPNSCLHVLSLCSAVGSSRGAEPGITVFQEQQVTLDSSIMHAGFCELLKLPQFYWVSYFTGEDRQTHRRSVRGSHGDFRLRLSCFTGKEKITYLKGVLGK